MQTTLSLEAELAAEEAVELREELQEEVRKGRLLYKLLGVFLLLSMVPLLLIGLQLIRVGDQAIQKQIIGAKTGIAQKVAANVKSYMEDKRNTLQIVHKSSDFLTMNRRRQTEILSNVMNAYPMFMRLQVMDLKGNEVSSVDRMGDRGRKDERIRKEALRAIRGLSDYRGPVSRSPEGYPQMVIGVPIEKIPGRPMGMLLAVVNLIDLSSLVKDIVIDKMGYVYIVDPVRKQLVAHPDVQTLLSADPPPEIQAAALAPEGRGQGAMEFKDQAGNKFLATFANVQDLQWRVFVQQPVSEAYGASRQMKREVLHFIAIVFVLTLLLGGFISQWITRRVQRLEAAMEQVEAGNFDVPEVPTSNDEFGSLTQKFLSMAQTLKEKTVTLVSAQKELKLWTTELERRVDERARDLRQAQDQLISQEKLAALGQMASVVGHELRNPLAVMNNSVYLLKSKLLKKTEQKASVGSDPTLEKGSDPNVIDPKIEKHLNVIESEIVKSNTIIRDVLDFARNRALDAKPHVLDTLVEHAIERIQRGPEIKLEKSLTLGQLEVFVDEDELRQVLVNLMENACQAMTSGGTLFVGTKTHKKSAESWVLSAENRKGKEVSKNSGLSTQDSALVSGNSGLSTQDSALVSENSGLSTQDSMFVEIRIADTGCGIPQEHLAKIFAPFFTTKSRGTGLGLAVVKKIIDRHDGHIEVKSVVGEGTAFIIRLPVKR